MGQITDSSNIDQRNLLCEEQKLFDGNLETGDKNQLSSLWTDFDGLKEVKAMVLVRKKYLTSCYYELNRHSEI